MSTICIRKRAVQLYKDYAHRILLEELNEARRTGHRDRITAAKAAERSRYQQVIAIHRTHHHLLRLILKEFGDIELKCEFRNNGKKLDVFFGGKDTPDGDGHAHWVFYNGALRYRRDPNQGSTSE